MNLPPQKMIKVTPLIITLNEFHITSSINHMTKQYETNYKKQLPFTSVSCFVSRSGQLTLWGHRMSSLEMGTLRHNYWARYDWIFLLLQYCPCNRIALVLTRVAQYEKLYIHNIKVQALQDVLWSSISSGRVLSGPLGLKSLMSRGAERRSMKTWWE